MSEKVTLAVNPKDASRRNYIAFEISGWKPYGKNQVMGPRGSYLVQKDKATVEFFAEAYINLNDWKLPDNKSPKRFVRVTIRKGPRGKVEDYDNFLHYMKPILDGLSRPCDCQKCQKAKVGMGKFLPGHKKIGAGLIVDDRPSWVEWDIQQDWGLQRAVIVEIWDA